MNITIDVENLKETLELVSKVSTKHVTLPVLQGVYIEVKGSTAHFKATNLEIGIEVTHEVVVEEEGVVAVPALVLLQTVSLTKQRRVTLKLEEGSLLVEGDGSETQIKCIPHEEFPNIPKIDSEGQVVEHKLLAAGIKSTAFAVSASSIKPELGSVYIHQKKENSLTFVATDSFRLMEKTVSQKTLVLENSVLLPQKNALEIARICENRDAEAVLRVSENQLSLQFSDGVYVTSRLTTGSFPDYEQIIPKEFTTTAIVLKEDLHQAFKKTNIFLNKFLQVTLTVSEKALTTSATSGEVGATTESVTAETEGEDLTLNFNQRYVVEALPQFSDDTIKLKMAGVGRPMVVYGTHNNNCRYLVMPMNK